MALNFTDIWEKVKKFYNERFKPLNGSQKFLWIGVFLAIIVGLSFLIAVNSSTKYVVLVSNLSDSNAGYITKQLNTMGIPYKAGPNGTIYIPQAQNVYNVRMKLATIGAIGPAAGVQGYGLLTNSSISSLGMTSFDRQVQYQIALAGELERSIDMIDSIQYSRVFLSLPKYTYYVPGQDEKPTASVLVILKPGMTLSSDQVLGIMNLVAGSVGNMSISNVKVVDQYSNVLSSNVDVSTDAFSGTSKLKLQQQVEKYYVDKVKSMLYNVFGYGNIAVAANIDLNWQKLTQETKTYVPADQKTDTGVISNQETESNGSANGVPSGTPGTYSNIPPTYASNSSTSGVSQYSKDITNYDVSQVYNQVIEDKSGEISHLTMTVFINATPTANATQDGQIRLAVANAVGQPASAVKILAMPFNRTSQKEANAAIAQLQTQQRFKMLIIYSLLLASFLTLAFFYIRSQMAKRKKLKAIEMRRKKIEEEVAKTAKVEEEPKNKELLELQDAIVDWVDESPEEVAQIIKIWMSKD